MRERLLIVRLSALGDTALTVPLLTSLRRQLPNAFIGWVTTAGPAELLAGYLKNGTLDRLHVLPKGMSRLAAMRAVVREIRDEGYTIALDAQGLTKSAAIPFFAGIPLRVGLARGRVEGRELSRLLNNRIVTPHPALRHITARTLWLLTALGLDSELPAGLALPVDDDALQRMTAWWRSNGLGSNTIVFGVGAGWPNKALPFERVAGLAAVADQAGWRSVFHWGPSEREALDAWKAAMPPGALLAPDTPVRDLMALISLAGRYAGPDSAGLHIAWLLGKPTFSWFGPSDPARCAPEGEAHAKVTVDCEIAPCWNRTCPRGECVAGLSGERLKPAFSSWMRTVSTT